MKNIPPHIPHETTDSMSRVPAISKYLILTVIVAGLAGFIASLLYTAYGPTTVSRLETRVEKEPEGFEERRVLAARESMVTFISEKDVIGEAVGYGTAITSDGWVLTAIPQVKGKRALFHPQSVAKLDSVVTDPSSPLVFVKTNSKNVRVLNYASLASLTRGAKLAIVTPSTAFPVTLQELSTCTSDRCPWEYGDRVSYAASIVEVLGGVAIDGAGVINQSGALVGVAARAHNGRVTIIPIEAAQPLFESVFARGVIDRTGLAVRALNLTRWAIPDTAEKYPERGMLIETLSAAGNARYTTTTTDLKDGDVIVRINREPIEANTVLFDMLRLYRNQGVVPMTVLRKGETMEISVRLIPLQ